MNAGVQYTISVECVPNYVSRIKIDYEVSGIWHATEETLPLSASKTSSRCILMDLCLRDSRTARLSQTGLLNTRCQDQSTGLRFGRNVDVMINAIRPQSAYCILTKMLCNAYLMDVMILIMSHYMRRPYSIHCARHTHTPYI